MRPERVLEHARAAIDAVERDEESLAGLHVAAIVLGRVIGVGAHRDVTDAVREEGGEPFRVAVHAMVRELRGGRS